MKQVLKSLLISCVIASVASQKTGSQLRRLKVNLIISYLCHVSDPAPVNNISILLSIYIIDVHATPTPLCAPASTLTNKFFATPHLGTHLPPSSLSVRLHSRPATCTQNTSLSMRATNHDMHPGVVGVTRWCDALASYIGWARWCCVLM